MRQLMGIQQYQINKEFLDHKNRAYLIGHGYGSGKYMQFGYCACHRPPYWFGCSNPSFLGRLTPKVAKSIGLKIYKSRRSNYDKITVNNNYVYLNDTQRDELLNEFMAGFKDGRKGTSKKIFNTPISLGENKPDKPYHVSYHDQITSVNLRWKY